MANRWDLDKYYPFRVKVDLGVMTVKEYFTLLRSLELDTHNQMQFMVVLRAPALFDRGSYPSTGNIFSVF